jgi:hypothetical protein
LTHLLYVSETATKQRKQRGRPFVKGKTGNPNGRPRKTPEIIEIEALAKTMAPEALKRLADWMRSDNAKASVSAANAIIERGYGKAKQHIEATLNDERMVVRAPEQPADADDWRSKHGPH